MWKKQSQMSFQIEVKPQRTLCSSLNCPKCGNKYKSLRSYTSNFDVKIIQIIEGLNCNYSYSESWEISMGGHILEEPFFNFHINIGRHPFLYMSSVTGLLPLGISFDLTENSLLL